MVKYTLLFYKYNKNLEYVSINEASLSSKKKLTRRELEKAIKEDYSHIDANRVTILREDGSFFMLDRSL